MELIEEKLKTHTNYHGVIVNVRLDEARLPDGSTAKREVVEHPGGVTVLPLEPDGTVWCVRQYRYPFSRTLLEVPAGKLEPRARKRIAVLPHAPDRAVGLQRQDRHAARMLHDLALGRAAVGQTRLVEPDVDDHTVVAREGLELLFDQFHETSTPFFKWNDTIFLRRLPYILSSKTRARTLYWI